MFLFPYSNIFTIVFDVGFLVKRELLLSHHPVRNRNYRIRMLADQPVILVSSQETGSASVYSE